MIRKIIHVDMDCFYAAIEMRDNPHLMKKPIAVGGPASARGVICTCNYVARQYGIHSAMATGYAKKLCSELIVLPVNMKKYQEVSDEIHDLFKQYTHIIEPLSLDEAFLDVTESPHQHGSATWIAKEIQQKIWEKLRLTASAGVAPNKFLAKIASGWNKPNGLFVIPPKDIEKFIKKLPVTQLFGVGKVTAQKLNNLGLKKCEDIQQFSLKELTKNFGKFGIQLYEQSHGIDNRVVEPNRIRKSLSVEKTFPMDINNSEAIYPIIMNLYKSLIDRINEDAKNLTIKNQYIKIKSSQFKISTLEKITQAPDLAKFIKLFDDYAKKDFFSIRLIGLGVHFRNSNSQSIFIQESFNGIPN